MCTSTEVEAAVEAVTKINRSSLGGRVELNMGALCSASIACGSSGCSSAVRQVDCRGTLGRVTVCNHAPQISPDTATTSSHRSHAEDVRMLVRLLVMQLLEKLFADEERVCLDMAISAPLLSTVTPLIRGRDDVLVLGLF